MAYDFKFAGTALSQLYGVTTKTPPREVALYDGTVTDKGEYKDNGQYKNVPMTREIGFVQRGLRTADEITEQLINWLGYHQNGYFEFEDTDHPGMVTYAVLTNFGEVQQSLRRLRFATLKFSRTPFWYERRGMKGVVLTEDHPSVNLFNPYPIDALPKIIVHFKSITSSYTFQIYVNSVAYNYRMNKFTLNGTPERWYAIFDCDTEEAYSSTDETGSDIAYADVDTPAGLSPGDNSISASGWTNSIDRVTIIPRWRCL